MESDALGWVGALPRRALRKARHLAAKALVTRRGPAAIRLAPNTWKQDPRVILADVLGELGPEPVWPAGPLRIAHIVNPFTAAKVAPRIAAAYGDPAPRFVAVLRDPVTRAYSHFRDCVGSGAEGESFAAALAREGERLAADPGAWVGYSRDGMYATDLETYFRHFDRSLFLIVRYEDLARDAGDVARRVFAFLGLSPDVPLDADRVYNAAAVPRSGWLRDTIVRPAAWKWLVKAALPAGPRRAIKKWLLRQSLRAAPNPPIPPEVEQALRARFEPEVARLEALLGWDLAAWRFARPPG